MLLSGSLSNWSVGDLLQIMRVTAKTATLRVDGSRPGVIHFNEGRIVGAGLAGQRVPRSSEEALRSTVDSLHALTALRDGAFLVAEPDFDPVLRGWDVAEVMLEVDRLRQMEQDVLNQGVNEHSALTLATEVATPVTLHAEEWAAMCALVPSFSLGSLQETFGNSRALGFLSALLNRGLTAPAEVAAPAPEETIPAPEPIVLNEVSVAEMPAEELPVLDWLGGQDDDDADLEANLSSTGHHNPDEVEDEARRRALRSVVAAPETTLVSNVLGDMRKLRTGQS